MQGDLAGFTIGVTADRRAAELADLLRRRGAEVRIASAMSTRPLLSAEALATATTSVIDEPPDVFIANTAIGILAWLAAAEAAGVDQLLAERLAAAVVLARGPKSAGALRQYGIEPSSVAPTERLSAVVEFAMTVAPAGAHIVLQLDGAAESAQVERLRQRGFRVTTIGTYRWDEPDEPEAVARLIHQVLEGAVDALTFTSPPAVRYLVALANERGYGDALRDPDRRCVVACVGPVTAEAASALGLGPIVFPTPGRMGLMVRVLSDALALRCRDIVIDHRPMRVRGRLVEVGDAQATLSRIERAVFEVLAERGGAVVAVDEILESVWGSRSTDLSNLHTAVVRLRQRLAEVGLDVQVVRRRGYRLRPVPGSRTS
jgi:uroporphyrinogen-III synthase